MTTTWDFEKQKVEKRKRNIGNKTIIDGQTDKVSYRANVQ